MNISKSIVQNLKSPVLLSFVCFLLFLAITSYKYGWDDQHLEIPLLKSLIDPTLYQGDYYVESLKINFTSYFYPILARLIKIDQIPSVYFFLWLLSRYFMIFWIYKLWLLIGRNRLYAFSAVMVFVLMARVQEFLYRTFSHQEFALAIIFAGIYYFFKDRIILASILLGIAANFHALYSLFPMLFILLYLFCEVPKKGVGQLFKAGFIFTLFSLPFLIWMGKNRILHASNFDIKATSDWMELFIKACPQNFIFSQHSIIPWSILTKNILYFFDVIKSYLLLISIFSFHLIFNSDFRMNKKAVCFCVGAFSLILLCFLFTYVWPHPFFIDLNLERNSQFLLFLLMGFTTIYVLKEVEQGSLLNALVVGILFSMLKFSDQIAMIAFLLLAVWLTILKVRKINHGWKWIGLFLLFVLLVLMSLFLVERFNLASYPYFIYRNLTGLLLGLIILYGVGKLYPQRNVKKWFILLPLCVFLLQYVGYHNVKINDERSGQGFWKLQRSWEDMQRFVKFNTSKDAMIFTPYNMEMGGFRMFSDRKVVVCYRDCGIIGFDFKAAKEWQRRINDVEAYKVSIDQPITQSVKNAISIYHANYIVFIKYAAPREDSDILQRFYTNDDFVLFKVIASGM